MFVDEAQIRVEAGSGGRGCLSFRREKHTPRGGPDGGNGDSGGSIYMVADTETNTLISFQYDRLHRAENGAPGGGRNSTGRSGEDLLIPVPVGTMIFDAQTKEFIGELTKADQQILVARGGTNGLGNAHFKSSTNRSPRVTTVGKPGDFRVLRLELSLLADVGLVGLPNAGKSSLIRVLTNARPKTAPFPFTTLVPSLGVVTLERGRRFTVADVPGLIEGASGGSGLGIQFLKHLRHTRLLFQLVDIAETDDLAALIDSIQTIETELFKFDEELASKTRWLVFNKIDLLPADEVEARVQLIADALGWKQKAFQVCALTGEGCKLITDRAMTWLEENPQVLNAPEPTETIEA